MAADQPGVVWMPVPPDWIWPNQNDKKYVVIHKTASPGQPMAQQVAQFFANDVQGKKSAHYVIGVDGKIIQCVSEKDAAGANCCTDPGHAAFLKDYDGKTDNLNWHSISIEHCDSSSANATPLSTAQKAASFKLIHDICARHKIPMQRPAGPGLGGIIGHSDIAPRRKALCPNVYPWEELWVYLKGGTVSELLHFPFVNQRTDGNINHDFDCVPSSLEAGANYLLGKSAIDDSAMKNAIYGANYVGGTGASAYVDYLAARGIKLYAVHGPLSLVHQHLAAGHPVVFTRDDPYSSNPNFSHVSVWYKDTATSLTAMDPFGAHSITMSDADWMTHLRGNEYWILERIDDMIDLTDPWCAQYFKRISTSPERWHCEKTGQDLFAGVLAGWKAMNGAPRLPVGPETKCGDKAVYQQCESGVILYDPLKEIDAPSGPWAPCYLLKLGSDLAKHLLGVAPAPEPVDTTALENSIHAIVDGIAPLVAAALVEAKKL